MPTLPLLHGAARLDDWGVVRAEGADAATFLHGQLTNDVSGLGAASARIAGFCSAKGRLQASFVIWRPAPETVFLACSASLLAPTLKRLSMFVLRAKCKLTDATAEMPLVGLVGDAAAGAAGALDAWGVRADASGAVIRLPDAAGLPRALAVGAVAASVDAPELPLAHWRWLELQSGIVTIEAATVDRFVPQMLNHELVGAVDFAKGCYPGQEVVARSQYRGTIKRRTLLFDCAVVPAAGQDVFAAGEAAEPAGTVANAAPHPGGGGSALVEVRLAALEAGELHLGAPGGPRLERRELPYPVPLEATPAA